MTRTTDADVRFALLDLDDSPRKRKQPEPEAKPVVTDFAAIARAALLERMGVGQAGAVPSPQAPITQVGVDRIAPTPQEVVTRTVRPVECTPAPVDLRHSHGPWEAAVPAELEGIPIVPVDTMREFRCDCGAHVRTRDTDATQCRTCREGRTRTVNATPTRARGVSSQLRTGVNPLTGETPAVPEPATPAIDRTSLRRDVVIGAQAGAEGKLFAWRGRGELERNLLTNSPAYKLPAIKTAIAHGGDAVGLANRVGYIARRDRKFRSGSRGKARWFVVADTGSGELGGDYGKTVVTATLTHDDQLEVECHSWRHEGVASDISAEYQRTTGGEIYRAGQVTDWLSRYLAGECGAVHLGVGWYVPNRYADHVTELCTYLRDALNWGCDWSIGLPVVTSDQWLDAIATDGINGQLRDIEQELKVAREQAHKAGNQDIGPRAATTLVEKVQGVLARASAEYTALLGPERTENIRNRARTLLTEVEGLVTDTAIRGALLELD